MKHRFNKAKFGFGKDANKMMLRKLAHNFLTEGKLETTKRKAKAAQSIVERIVTKAKTNTEADKKFILKHITEPKVLTIIVGEIAPALKDVKSGYTRVVNVGMRMTDGADIARLEWAYPVVLNRKEEVKKTEKKAEKKAEPKKETKAETVEEKKEVPEKENKS